MKSSMRSIPWWITCVVLLVSAPAGSQSFRLGGGLGLASPASDLGGSTVDYYQGSQYGLTSGLSLLAKAKVGLAGFVLAGEVGYSSFGNSGNSEPGQGAVDVSVHVISIKVGPELHFSLPALPMTPYLGANVAMNNFSGETTFQGVSKVPSGTYSVDAATRFGLGFVLGAEVGIGPLLQLDFNFSYNMMNLIGREWQDMIPGADERIDSYLALNDSADPRYAIGDDKHFISKDRNLHSFQFTMSVLFGL